MESILNLGKPVWKIGTDQIDWKQIKKEWDEDTVFFSVRFQHGANELQFRAELYKKRYKLMIYINGWFKGEYSNAEHDFSKYMNKKELKPSKNLKELFEANKRLAKLKKEKYEPPKPYYMYLPIFANISEVKRMIENLEKL